VGTPEFRTKACSAIKKKKLKKLFLEIIQIQLFLELIQIETFAFEYVLFFCGFSLIFFIWTYKDLVMFFCFSFQFIFYLAFFGAVWPFLMNL